MVLGLAWRWWVSRSVKNASRVGASALMTVAPLLAQGAPQPGTAAPGRQGSAPADLRVPDRDHSLVPVDVVPVEAHYLPRAHAGGRDEPDEGLIGGCPQR